MGNVVGKKGREENDAIIFSFHKIEVDVKRTLFCIRVFRRAKCGDKQCM